MADIFLSYAREDQPLVERLAAALEEAGYSVWWDRHLTGGHDFSDDIEAELTGAKVAVVAWSEKSAKSHWVRDEAADAREAGKLVPLTLDGSKPPMGFRQLHTIDLTGWPRRAEAIQPLLAAIALQVGKEAQPPSTPAPSPKSKAPLAIILTLALALIAAGTWWMMGRSNAPGDAAAATQERAASLAVMPFRDLSPDQDQQWFSDGLAEEITSALSRVPDLYVAASGDAFALRDDNLATNEIADRLRVDHVLGGSIRRAGANMRITVELVKADDGERVWSQSYDRSTDDAIAVQEDIAQKVASALDTALDPAALKEMVDTGTRSIEAYETLLRAEVEGSYNLESSNAYLEQLAEAHRLDPDWPMPLLVDAGFRYYRMSSRTYGWVNKDVALADAAVFEDNIARVIEMTKDSTTPSDVLAREQALAYRDGYHLRFKAAADRFLKLARKYPNKVELWSELVIYSAATGDYTTEFMALEKMVDLHGPNGFIIAIYEKEGDWDRGLQLARQVLKEDSPTHDLLRAGMLLAITGNREEAMQAHRWLAGRNDLPFSPDRILLYAACQAGDLETVRRIGQTDEDLQRWADFYLDGKSWRKTRYAGLDRSEPPFLVIGWGYAPWEDMADFPLTRAALDAAGVPHSQPQPNKFRCPGGYQGD